MNMPSHDVSYEDIAYLLDMLLEPVVPDYDSTTGAYTYTYESLDTEE